MSDDDISDDEEVPITSSAAASNFSIFTSKSLKDARDEIFSDVRSQLPGLGGGASDDDDDIDEDDEDESVEPIFSALAHTPDEVDLYDPDGRHPVLAQRAPRCAGLCRV